MNSMSQRSQSLGSVDLKAGIPWGKILGYTLSDASRRLAMLHEPSPGSR